MPLKSFNKVAYKILRSDFVKYYAAVDFFSLVLAFQHIEFISPSAFVSAGTLSADSNKHHLLC